VKKDVSFNCRTKINTMLVYSWYRTFCTWQCSSTNVWQTLQLQSSMECYFSRAKARMYRAIGSLFFQCL